MCVFKTIRSSRKVKNLCERWLCCQVELAAVITSKPRSLNKDSGCRPWVVAFCTDLSFFKPLATNATREKTAILSEVKKLDRSKEGVTSLGKKVLED